ncbi:MAG TPA: hypothetical protein VKR58_06080 [Aquella sp.]|nr:hypothetical protein [Aquella sp.]
MSGKLPVDLCKIPLAKGNVLDYTQINSIGVEERYLFKILEVRGDIAGEREIDVKKLSATTDNAVPFISTLKLNPSLELKAYVTNTEPDPDTKPSTPEEWNKQIVSELAKWLQTFPHDNFRKPFPVCLDYLVNLGLYPKFDKEVKYQKKKHTAVLRGIIKRSNGVLVSTAGWITYVKGVDESNAEAHKMTNRVIANAKSHTIYMYHVIKCIENFCLSGLLYDSDTITIDYGKNPNYKE